jgi:AraC-like DNA-binding protein
MRSFKLNATLSEEASEPRRVEVHDRASLPNHFGETRFERIALDGGAAVAINRVTPANDIEIMAEASDENRIISSIFLKGRASITVGDNHAICPQTDTGYAFRYRNEPTRFNLKAGAEVVTFGVSVPVSLYARYLGDDIPDALRCWIAEPTTGHHLKTFKAPRELRAIFMGSESIDFVGPLRRAYFEGAALIYVSLVANEIAKQQGQVLSLAASSLTKSDIDAVEAARSILLQDIAEPPTLSALAQAVGLSEKRLNQAFKLRFGTTVFELLRKERLDYARLLLEETGMVPKEVAWASGYRHVSNFSNAFRRQFGYSPAKYKHR